MSETSVAEPTTAERPKPDAADRKPRAITSKPPVADPEAPYGWIKDPKAPGGKRPKLRPGKQAKTETPPRERPANRARSAPKGTTTATDTGKIAADVTALVQGTWLLLAAVPEADFKIPGTKMTVSDVSVRTRAQAAILEDNGESLVKGLVMTAQHSPTVAKILAKAGEESGPAWIIPAMMAMMPFVVQSAAMWNAPAAGDVAKLAERTKSELDSMLKGTQPEASANGHNPDGTGSPVSDAQAHPHP